jgi:outer membrane translocation and assembly module TamA
MAALIYSLVALLAIAAPAAAQSTRVDAIAEEQAEKAKGLGAEGPGRAEQVIRRVLLSPLLDGGDGIYPWFGSVYSGTGMGLGVGFLKRLENAAYVNLQSGLSLNNSMLMRGTFAAPGLWRGMLQVDTTAQWLDARGVSFYGFGQDSDQTTRERFDYRPRELTGNATLKPIRFVSVTGTYTYLDLDTERDAARFTSEQAPGLDQDLTYHVTRGTMMFDWRQSPGYSTRGGFYRLSVERHHEANGRPFSFAAQEYEVVQLLPLVREQFVLAARGLMTLTSTASGHDVPVALAPTLGSASALRGFANRRFTDRNRLLLSGEYRWRPSRYLDMALFMDAGQVAADRRDFRTEAFDVAWGVGARFHGPTFNALRVELARGREGIRLVFSGSQPF